jgi:hypothetical protein
MGLLLTMPLALGSCGVATDAKSVTPGTSDRWSVSVLGPRDGASIDHCFEDPLIEESIQSADLPSTHLGIKLLETATQEDAERIAGCLRERLSSGEVSIRSPKR